MPVSFCSAGHPSPGKALYVGYNDNFNYNGINPFTGASIRDSNEIVEHFSFGCRICSERVFKFVCSS